MLQYLNRFSMRPLAVYNLADDSLRQMFFIIIALFVQYGYIILNLTCLENPILSIPIRGTLNYALTWDSAAER